MDASAILDAGFGIALGFFALGILFLFICDLFLGTVGWIKDLIG